MHSPFKVGILFALIWLGLRFGLSQVLEPTIALKAGIMLNILFILLAIFFVFYFTKRKQGFAPAPAMEDLKLALKGGIVYVVLISGAIYAYYSIDTSLFDMKAKEFDQKLANKTKEQLIVEKDSNPETKSFTTEEYIKKARENANKLASPGVQTMFSMLALTVWCLFASIFCTFIFRKVLLSPNGR